MGLENGEKGAEVAGVRSGLLAISLWGGVHLGSRVGLMARGAGGGMVMRTLLIVPFCHACRLAFLLTTYENDS